MKTKNSMEAMSKKTKDKPDVPTAGGEKKQSKGKKQPVPCRNQHERKRKKETSEKENDQKKQKAQKKKEKEISEKQKEEKKLEKAQKKKALDERDYNLLDQLSQLNKSVLVFSEHEQEIEEKEKELERRRLEISRKEEEMRRKEAQKGSLKHARDTRKENDVLSRLNKAVVVTSKNDGEINEKEKQLERRLDVSRKEDEVRRKKRMSNTRENEALFNRLRNYVEEKEEFTDELEEENIGKIMNIFKLENSPKKARALIG